jgi:hypothetical protein
MSLKIFEVDLRVQKPHETASFGLPQFRLISAPDDCQPKRLSIYMLFYESPPERSPAMPNARSDAFLRPQAPVDEAVRAILDSIGRIRFGSISITLHEGKVVQLDITEKRRL